MKDVQSENDRRGKVLHKVGVRNVATLVNGFGGSAWATVSMYITLDDIKRGAHMSRFVEVLERHTDSIDTPVTYMNRLLQRLRKAHGVDSIFVKLRTDLPKRVTAPVSKKFSWRRIPYEIEAECSLLPSGEYMHKYFIRLQQNVTSLCPCSKEISDGGAHNQRAIIDVRAQLVDEIDFQWLRAFSNDLDTAGSAPIYNLVKRPDEKYVTEQAYDNPRFVEDIAREVALIIDEIASITNYSVVIDSEESIHDHNALAIIDHFKFA